MNKGPEGRLPSRSRAASCVLLALALISSLMPAGWAAPPQQGAKRSIVVQVGAFRGPTGASELASRLKEKDFSATVVPGADYYRVVLGPFANDAEANTAITRLKAQGFDGYLRRDITLPQSGSSATRSQPAPTRQATPARPAPTQPRPQATPPREPSPPPQRAPQPPTPQPQPAPPAVPDRPVTQNQPAAQPPPVPRPGIPPTQAETQPTVTEPAPTPTTPRVAETVPAPPERPLPPATETPERSEPREVAALPPAAEPRAPGIAAIEPARGSRLKILVLEGQGAINNIRQRTSRDPVVQVVDENDRPVAGVALTFALPSRGASGVFANGARSMTILTDAQGMATATGFAPNSVAGDLAIQVSASHQGQTASTLIAQSNVAAGAGMSAATIGIIGAIAAGAAVGAVIAFGGEDKPPTTPTVPTAPPSGTATVRPGGVTIGVPSP